MSCPNEAQLIRIAAGESDLAEKHHVEQHLRECRHCAAALDQLRATWGDLAAWTEDEPVVDLWPALQATLAIEARRTAGWLPRTMPAVLRAAASVVIAVGLGWATGAVIGQRDASPEESPVASIDEVLEPLGLETLAIGSGAGLQAMFEETDENVPEEDS